MSGIHYHSCPHCYEAHPCAYGCTIEPDLEDRGRPFGSHLICGSYICHIDRAIKKHNDRLDRRKEETIRKLQSAPRIVGVSERVHDPRWDTIRYEVPPQHRYTDPVEAMRQVEPGGTLVIVGGAYRLPTGVHDMKGVTIVATVGASIDARGVTFGDPLGVPLIKVVPPPFPRAPARKRWLHLEPSSKIRPHGVR